MKCCRSGRECIFCGGAVCEYNMDDDVCERCAKKHCKQCDEYLNDCARDRCFECMILVTSDDELCKSCAKKQKKNKEPSLQKIVDKAFTERFLISSDLASVLAKHSNEVKEMIAIESQDRQRAFKEWRSAMSKQTDEEEVEFRKRIHQVVDDVASSSKEKILENIRSSYIYRISVSKHSRRSSHTIMISSDIPIGRQSQDRYSE